MMNVGLGLGASVAWGSADFAAAIASRSSHPQRIALLSQAVALPPLVIAVLVTGAHWSQPLFGLAAVAGLFDAIGVIAFYSALSVGSVSVVSPIAALGAVVPLCSDAATGHRLGTVPALAAVVAVAGAALAARESGVSSTQGIGRAVVAALAFGGFFALLPAAAGHGDGLGAATVARAATLVVVLIAFGLRSRRIQAARASLNLVLTAGLLDGLASLAYITGAGAADAGVVAAAASTYPAVTVVLAARVLGDRPRATQLAGIVAAVAGTATLAAAA